MKKIIIVKQHDLSDCGPACLSSIIMYHGGYVPIEMIRINSYTSNSGTSAYDLINCAKKYGLEASGQKVDDIRKVDNQRCPFIAHLIYPNGLNHYVVIYKIDQNKITIMDPKMGKVKINIDKFNQNFSKVIITFHPIDKLSKFQKPDSIFKLISKFIKNNKKDTFLIVLISNFLVFISVILNYYIKTCNSLNNGSFGLTLIINVFVIFILLYILKNFVEYYKNKLIINLNKNISCELYENFSNKIFHLPLSFIKSKTSGEIISRYNELSEINELVPSIIIGSCLDLIMSFIAIVFSSMISIELTLITILYMIVYFIIGLSLKNPTLKKINKNLDVISDFNSEVIESINNLRSIKYLGNEDNMEKRVNRFGVKSLLNNLNLNYFYNKTEMLKNILYDLCFYTISSFGILLSIKGQINIIDLFTFIMIINYFTEPIKDIVNMITKLCFIKSSIIKLSEFSIIKENNKFGKEFSNGDINVENLSFAYNGLNYILKNFTCNIKKGSKVLVQGDSGSGKSTLCQIISKQLFNYEGSVKINNEDIFEISDDSLRRNITYIGQKDSLIVDTIENNIKYERNIDDKEYHTICRICEIDKIVKNKLNCYQNYISESSDNISGGEKQRIALARGLIASGEIIILDESLSEVNKLMEERIIKRIFKHFSNKTIIYVSHKEYGCMFDRKILV